jgi:hypothetical protein
MADAINLTKGFFWNKANQFWLELEPTWKPLPSGFNTEKMNTCLVSLELPDIANENFEEYYAGQFNLALGRNSTYQLTATFRDPWALGESGDGSLLYMYFKDYLVTSRKKYLVECGWTLNVKTMWPGAKSKKKILTAEDCLLVGVSNISFNQSNDEIVEFSVTFKFSLTQEEGSLRKVSSS